MPENSRLLLSPFYERLDLAPERDGALWRHAGGARDRAHRHEELEVNLCVAGHAFYLVGEARYRLARRSLLWLFPAQNHVLIETSPDFEMWIAVWKPRLLEAVCRHDSRQLRVLAPAQTWIKRLQSEDAARLENLFERVSQSASLDGFNAGLGFGLTESLAVWERGDQTIAGRAVHPAIERAARILNQRAPALPALAREVGLSPGRLSRLFGAQIGVSVSQFRSRRALERFAKIYDGQISITEAAFEASFGSYAQFNRVFAAHHGCSSTQYRARLRRNETLV